MSARPTVALLTSYPPDHRTFSGGVQTATASLLDGLKAHVDELDVHVVAAGDASRFVREVRDGLSFHFLPGVRRRWQRPRFAYRGVAAAAELRRIRPDLVHAQDTLLLALAAWSGRYPKLFSVHGIKRAEARLRTGWEGAAARFEAAVETTVRGRFDAVVCNSRYAARAVGPARRVFSIPNGVADGFFAVQRRPDPSAPTLLFVGALAPLKRPADLLQAHVALLREHPGLHTSFCGPVEDRGYVEDMKRRVAAEGIGGVAWEGVVPRERLFSLLERATALVLPSLQENAPMVVAEAMAAGVPVVATRVGGIPEMVSDGVSGALVAPGDASALSERIGRLLADPDAAAALGARAQREARARYSTAAVASATVAAYRALLGGEGAR